MKKYPFLIIPFLPICVILLVIFFTHGKNIALFNPAGMIAASERGIILIFFLLAVCIAVPLFLLTFFIIWKYREDNPNATYSPNIKHGKLFELTWWAFPTVVVLFLASITWVSTHALDPQKALHSPIKPLVIQVVALQWKWLFLYPQQHIATVNFIQFPVNTPIEFQLTADAPMNSFWIPNLSGQIYAMTGMETHLHIIATTIGEYPGSDAEISGEGFAGMKFIAKVSSTNDFEKWVHGVQQSQNILTDSVYTRLAQPSSDNKAISYSSVEKDLYNTIIMQYTVPGTKEKN